MLACWAFAAHQEGGEELCLCPRSAMEKSDLYDQLTGLIDISHRGVGLSGLSENYGRHNTADT